MQYKIKAGDPLKLSLYFENKVATGIVVKKCNQNKNISDIENDIFEIINQLKTRQQELELPDKVCDNVINLLEQAKEKLRNISKLGKTGNTDKDIDKDKNEY